VSEADYASIEDGVTASIAMVGDEAVISLVD